MVSKVEVYVRCRPVDGDEIPLNSETTATGTTITVPKIGSGQDEPATEREYQVDGLWPGSASQTQMFENVALPVVERVLDGYNGTICCYGATGTGKTYTIFGERGNEGMLSRAIQHLFRQQEVRQSSVDIGFVCSFLEIYLDKTYDLLGDRDTKEDAYAPDKGLQLRQNSEGLVYAEGLTLHPVGTKDDMIGLLKQGMQRRATYSTASNERSSRSHSIFFITVNMKNRLTSTTSSPTLTFVDLAGSERLAKSASEGTRKLEAASINRSLSALGNVVQALARGASYIPYRDSKLTRILKDAFGGSCHTTMVCTVCPRVSDYEETMSTISFAHRCRNITNQPKVSVVDLSTADAETRIRKLVAEVAELRTKLYEEEGINRSLNSRIGDLAALLEKAGGCVIGPGGELLDADGNLILSSRGSRSRPSSAYDDGKSPLSSPTRRRVALRGVQDDNSKALRTAVSQMQAKLEQRTTDLRTIQAESRTANERTTKQIAEQKAEIDRLMRELTAQQYEHTAEVTRLSEEHAREIQGLLRSVSEAEARNARLLTQLPQVAAQKTRDDRTQADIEAELRCTIEAEKSTFAAELDCLMINQREELQRHFQYELNLLQQRLRDAEEQALTRERDYANRLQKLLNAASWLAREYGRVSRTLHECCEGKHPVALIAAPSSGTMRTHPRMRSVAEAPGEPSGGACMSSSNLKLVEDEVASEHFNSTPNVSEHGGVAHTVEDEDLQIGMLTGTGRSRRYALSTTSPGNMGVGRGLASACPGYSPTQTGKPVQHGAIVLPLNLYPAPVPADHVETITQETTELRELRYREEFTGGAPVSPPRGGTPLVTNPSLVATSRPASAVGLSTIRPYSGYSNRPYDYELTGTGKVRKVRPRSSSGAKKFITTVGSPTRYPGGNIENDPNVYNTLQPQAQSRATSGASTASVASVNLAGTGSMSKQRQSTSAAVSGTLTKTLTSRPASSRRVAPATQAPTGPPTKARIPGGGAASPWQDNLNLSSIASRDGESELSKEQMLMLELEQERRKTRRLKQATLHQQYLLNGRAQGSGRQPVTRASRIEIYEK
ncbi:Kinesin like protein [Giardia muris]|uniref:Kinesin like protein n=1 Tax=Giardia muris TaxID=5742 RepID=A0A4Z1SR92_GIAMU|nr:Kinesin like protein [Giardia muris]|eukprot:TNJ28230.1 Kinesin like protein [Giardia muris]